MSLIILEAIIFLMTRMSHQKNQDELRAYLLKNFYWVKGYKLTFRMADINIKPTIGYMHDRYVNVVLTYDSKNNLYTVTAKGK